MKNKEPSNYILRILNALIVVGLVLCAFIFMMAILAYVWISVLEFGELRGTYKSLFARFAGLSTIMIAAFSFTWALENKINVFGKIKNLSINILKNNPKSIHAFFIRVLIVFIFAVLFREYYLWSMWR